MRSTILAMKEEFEGYFKERDDEINGALLAILAGEHILFLGPPGTAKTLLASKICDTVEGGDFFYYLLTRFSTPEEIFGPLSLKSLENDEFKRKIDGCLPTAHVALLDEIFKANSSILNSLLTILNERKFHNGTNVTNVPLLSVFGASNELPEEAENLEALYDRFLFRFNVEYIKNEKNLEELIFENVDDFSPSTILSLEQIQDIRDKSKSLGIPQEVKCIIQELRRELRSHDITISDRRWKKIVNTLKVAAVASGFNEIDKTTLVLLQHMLWDLPEQKETIRKMVINSIVSNGVNSTKLKNDLEDLKNVIPEQNYEYTDVNSPLPINVICNTCHGYVINNTRELTNHKNCSSYSFETNSWGKSSQIMIYDEIIKELRRKHNFTIENQCHSPENKIRTKGNQIFINELLSLKNKFEQLKSSLIDENKIFKDCLNENVWISFHDRNEILLKREDKVKELYELEKAINKLSQQLETESKIKTDDTPTKNLINSDDNFSNLSLNDIRKEVNRLEFSMQTEVLTPNKERELNNRIVELQKLYAAKNTRFGNKNDSRSLGGLFG